MFDKCIYFNLVTLTRKINAIWQQAFGRLGLSPSNGYLLCAMMETPTATQKELSTIMELDTSTITRFIDTLIKKGLVEKEGLGKGSKVTVTIKGKQEYKKIITTMEHLYTSMQKKIGPAQFKEFVTSTKNMRTVFSED